MCCSNSNSLPRWLLAAAPAAALLVLPVLLLSVRDVCCLPVVVISNERLSEPEAVCKSSTNNTNTKLSA
jgi:hypothetical protein